MAAEIYGVKRNLRFVFQTRPMIKELTKQVVNAFQREAVINKPEGITLIEFNISHMHIHGEGGWIDLQRQRQLQHGVQIYAFQKKQEDDDDRNLSNKQSRRGRSSSPNCPPSPRRCEVEGIRRAFIDKIRCVFQALSNSSDKIKVTTLEESLRQRGIAGSGELTTGILQAVDSQFYMNLTNLSLAQFTRWGRKHPVDVDLLYSKCDVLRWATPVKSRKRSVSARGAPEAAVSPVPLPPSLPVGLSIPPPSPRVSAPLPIQLPKKTVMAQSILGDASVIASPPKMLFQPTSYDSLPPRVSSRSSSMRRASGGCRTLSPVKDVNFPIDLMSSPISVPAVMPVTIPSVLSTHGLVQPFQPVMPMSPQPDSPTPVSLLSQSAPPIPLQLSATPSIPLPLSATPPFPKPWESWLGTEIKRLEAEHQAKVASLYARLNRQ